MLVTQELFPKVMEFISKPGVRNSIDTETEGLEYWKPDIKIFSVIVARGKDVFYFNFNKNPSRWSPATT